MDRLEQRVARGIVCEDGPEEPTRESEDLVELGWMDLGQHVLPRFEDGFGIVMSEMPMAVAAHRAAGGLEGGQQVLGPGYVAALGNQSRERWALAAEGPGGVAEAAQGQDDVVPNGLLDHLEVRAGGVGEQTGILPTAEQLAVIAPLEAESGEVFTELQGEFADFRREPIAAWRRGSRHRWVLPNRLPSYESGPPDASREPA
jgi:hypothetical protein